MANTKRAKLHAWVKANFPKFQDRIREQRLIAEASELELDFMLNAIEQN